MKELLVEYLICPKCGKNFTLKPKKKVGNEIVEGELMCLKRHRFPISKGVPRLVIDKSKIFIKTENSFSAKWKTHHRNHHAKDWIEFQRKWFLERFDWKSFSMFKKFLKSKNNILDAGTGIGNSANNLTSGVKNLYFHKNGN